MQFSMFSALNETNLILGIMSSETNESLEAKIIFDVNHMAVGTSKLTKD